MRDAFFSTPPIRAYSLRSIAAFEPLRYWLGDGWRDVIIFFLSSEERA